MPQTAGSFAISWRHLPVPSLDMLAYVCANPSCYFIGSFLRTSCKRQSPI